jgi:hypothetical protein
MAEVSKPLGKVHAFVQRHLLDPTQSAASLAVLRIAFAAVLVYDIGLTYSHKELLLDAVPFALPSRFPIGPALLIWLIAAGCLLVGLRTRAAALVSYIFSVLFIGFAAPRYGFDGHWDVVILHLGWVFVLLPVGRALSVDAALAWLWRPAGREHPDAKVGGLGELLIIGIIASMYLDSCAYKLCSPMYLHGLGLWAPASLPYALHGAHEGLLDNHALMVLMGYFALVYELSFVVLVWFRRWRLLLVAAGVCFHSTIVVFFPIWSFSLMMSALYLALVPPVFYERLFTRLFPRALPYLGLGGLEQAPESNRFSLALDPLRRWALLGGGAFWLGSLFTLFLASPFPATYLMVPKPFAAKLRTAAKSYKQLAFPWTGFSTHGVFMDQHFKDYTWQVRLVYRLESSVVELPWVNKDGLCIGTNSDHVWELWAFRTVAPGLKIAQVEANLGRFINFWSVKAHADLTRGSIEILTRPVEVSLTEWRPGLLRRNLLEPWAPIGRVQRGEGALRFEWAVPRRDDHLLADIETSAAALPGLK